MIERSVLDREGGSERRECGKEAELGEEENSRRRVKKLEAGAEKRRSIEELRGGSGWSR